MATIVLVHGAWSDGSIWRVVAEHLQADGHDVRVAHLPLSSLDDDVRAIRHELAGLDGAMTLVGHSYRGAVISEAARGDTRVRGLVFVAAYAPDEGDTIARLSQSGSPAPGGAAIRFGDDGWTTVDRERFAAVLAADLPAASGRALAVLQKPTRLSCLTTATKRGAWHDLPLCLHPVHGRPDPRPRAPAPLRRAHPSHAHRDPVEPPVAVVARSRGRRRYQ